MISSFKHKGLKKYFETGSTAGIQASHKNRLRIQLTALNTASNVEDMNLPGFSLHKLSGIKKQLWAISVNGNWRVTFEFENGNAYIVNYEDYH
jgi:proteic killer suppression protein